MQAASASDRHEQPSGEADETDADAIRKAVADSINEAATKAVINFTNSNKANLLRLSNSGSFSAQSEALMTMFDEHVKKAIEFLIHQGWRQAEFEELGKQAFPQEAYLWDFVISSYLVYMQKLDAGATARRLL